MKIVIIEDEVPAATHLERAVARYDPNIEVTARLDSVEGSVAWLQGHASPDLLLCDIELADGSALTIFERVRVTCPVVFCTAYDQYWTEAFAAGGIDYVLKPIEDKRLAQALDKYKQLQRHFTANLDALLRRTQRTESAGRFRTHLLAKRGVDHVSVSMTDVALFTTEHKIVVMVTRDGSRLLLDATLTDLMSQLDPRAFFRANRQYVIAFAAVEGFRSYGKGRVHVRLQHASEPVVISQENAGRFRAWMDR